MKKKQTKTDMVVYQGKNGAIELQTDVARETIWITQKQMGAIFGVDVRTVNEHLKNIFKTDELEREGKVKQVGNTGRGVAYRLKP